MPRARAVPMSGIAPLKPRLKLLPHRPLCRTSTMRTPGTAFTSVSTPLALPISSRYWRFRRPAG